MKFIKRTITFLFVILIFLIGYYIKDGYELYQKVINQTPIDDKVEQIRKSEGYVTLDAVISIEDRRFYLHKGIDIYSIGRALVQNIKNKKIEGGGSTITQQLAKNMYFDQKKKLSRKVAEIFVTKDLEERYSKDEILELYTNVIYFGDGYYGISEASKGYLNKLPSQLDLNDASLLAGLPNAPSVYQLSNNSNKTYERQIMVLKAMSENGYISEDEAQKNISKIKQEKNI